uniref:14 kDa phosphohistidine phosphatase n=1 Tax=Cyprinus carpio TaxID=7962 RepID=A0A8C2IP37_CYPCA
MSAERLAKIPEVDLDPNGVFKYVLIRVNSKDDDSYVDIVRGYAWAEYHGRVVCTFTERNWPISNLLRDGGLDCECLGGGRIKHDSKCSKKFPELLFCHSLKLKEMFACVTMREISC